MTSETARQVAAALIDAADKLDRLTHYGALRFIEMRDRQHDRGSNALSEGMESIEEVDRSK